MVRSVFAVGVFVISAAPTPAGQSGSWQASEDAVKAGIEALRDSDNAIDTAAL